MAMKDPAVIEYDSVRETIGGLIAEPGFSDGDNLVGLGLDSLKIMRLVSRWRKAGVKVTFAEMITEPTLSSWMEILRRKAGIDAERAVPASPLPQRTQDEPFPLTDVQYAYWIGRRDGQPLGGVGCHAYLELDGEGVEPDRLARAWRTVLAHHSLLRAAFLEDGRQLVLPEPASEELIVHDLREADAGTVADRLEQLREELSHRRFAVEQGRLAGLELCLLPDGRTRLFFDIDLLVADVQSFCIVLRDLSAAYARGVVPPAPEAWRFSDYLARKGARDVADRERDAAYWAGRLPELPGAPALPLKRNPEEVLRASYRRRLYFLSAGTWRALKGEAAAHEATAAMTLLTAYAEILDRWSSVPHFFINLPLFDRETGEEGLEDVVADFTNLLLVDVDCTEEKPFLGRLRDVQSRFYENVAHSSYSGVRIQRDIARMRPDERFIAPVVFACNLGNPLLTQECRETLGRLHYMLSQTPQVWLDFQMYETEDGGLALAWDTAEELFAEGLIDEMLNAYGRLLEWLAADAAHWECVPDVLPERQRERRGRDRALALPAPEETMHGPFFARAAEAADTTAVIDGLSGERITYGELAGEALRTAALLRRCGVERGTPVAVTLPRGREQIIAVLGVLAAGGFYVPVSPSQPLARRERIHRKIGVRFVLSRTDVLDAASLPSGAELIDIAERHAVEPLAELAAVSPDDLAYVIFTSGSTGEPKGVAIEHRSARNTIADINGRFHVGEGDVCLAVSSLDFDLSVYDIFGILSSGAAIVAIGEAIRRSAGDWRRIVLEYGVTVWNTVPILLDMLLVDAEAHGSRLPLRLAMLSGDWIGLDLPQRLKDAAPEARLIAMGGATEASIWSNVMEVEAPIPAEWKSIPYGRPLSRQSYRVVDAKGRDCPDMVDGELWIGGAGVARCYLGDPELTALRFRNIDGMRWYRTGDLGRFWPDGTIEFLGRADSQVKIRGHRIELGEIEAALKEHPLVKDVVAMPVSGARGIRRLGAYLVLREPAADEEGLFRGLEAFLRDRVPEYMVPSAFMALDALPLSANGKLDRKALPAFEEKAGEETRPATELESALARIWERILQVPQVGVRDNFFELGGDSLVATHLVAEVRKELGAELTLDRLFRFPDIAHLAESLEAGAQENGPVLPDAASLPAVEPREGERYEPFPLTDVQYAYWIGRIGAYELGKVSSHVYFEFDNAGMDIERLNGAWNRLIERHEMLRAVFLPDGTQAILPSVGEYRFPVYDLMNDAAPEEAIGNVRRAMSGQQLPADTWPLFDIRAARYLRDGEERLRLFLDFDAMIADAWSIFLLVDEWLRLYRSPGERLPELRLSFRDYVLAERKIVDTLLWRNDFEYWKNRLDDLPPAPELPLAKQPSELDAPRTVRLSAVLEAPLWEGFKARIRRNGLTPSGLLVAAYAETLARWSAGPRFTLNLTLFNRLPLHDQVNDVVGDFSSLNLLVVDALSGASFRERALGVQRQLWEDMSHRLVSGVQVLRELALRGKPTRMPIVFTGAVSLGKAGRDASGFSGMGTLVTSITQTPQVWLDHQTYEQEGRLMLNWDAVEGLFPEGLVEDMFDAYVRLLNRLAADDAAWLEASPLTLPEAQRQSRIGYNATESPLSGETLASLFLQQARATPDAPAVMTSARTLSYEEVLRRAGAIAHTLAHQGVSRGDLVGVVMEKGWEQVVAVAGIALAGAVYVPVDAHVPCARLEQIADGAGFRTILTQTKYSETLRWPEGALVVAVDDLPPEDGQPEAAPVEPDELAYIIYTSGSTGQPKGVAIDHRGAVNTLLDVNGRFGVGAGDRLFGLSALHFDLSVYDIWGALLSGAAVVLPDADRLKDPSHWLELASRHGVTIWNSVPMLVQMLVEYMEFAGKAGDVPLRLVLMSGDWIPLDLPRRIRTVAPEAKLFSLGGATEASIWSILYPIGDVLPEWKSIPYGRPMRNQRFHVLNVRLEACPDGVPGDLYIGGVGLAREYWRDAARTVESFVVHPETGERLYRTGDVGRMLRDGNIEFLGRKDFQVKIRGHRIELGEIEAVLLSRPDVREAVVVVTGENAAAKKLIAFIVPDGTVEERVVLGTVRERLPDYMVPSALVTLEALPLSGNGKVDRKRLLQTAGEAAFQERAAAPASSEAEKAVGLAWKDVLGRAVLNIDDNFFDVGGTSVLAVRLHRELAKRFGREFPLVSVFEYPSIRTLAAFLDEGMRRAAPAAGTSRRVEMRKKRRARQG